MQRVSLDSLDMQARQERRMVQRKRTSVSPKHERAMRRYKGADRSVTLGGVIAPPTKNAAKTAFGQNRPRLDTATPVVSVGNVVKVPGIYG